MLNANNIQAIPEAQPLINTIVDSVLALAALVAKQGGLQQRFEFAWGHSNSRHKMLPMSPRTKAPKGEQLGEALEGELGAYEKLGLFQRSVGQRTAYRYRRVLLRYQKALNSVPPSLEASRAFLAHLREQGFSPSSLRLYRAAMRPHL